MSAEEQKKDYAVPDQKELSDFVKKLEEDDEFEDFPEDDWVEPQDSTEAHDAHLWEESWEDHDDVKDHFIQRLRYVLNEQLKY